ncbi:hypothetical protein GGU10DRAFT_417412, partial [Lentinula aff. detonsa]
YALDEMLVTASDMYSLGCVIYAVHCKGNPPYTIRENAGHPISGMERLEPDLQALLRSLITRNHQGRPSPTILPSDPFFSSLPISTLNFLDRSNFTAKTREETSFMKGLTSVLSRFSEGLKSRKILPTLLEEVHSHLLPYILPNVFAIANSLSSSQFASMVLPSLTPLFAVKEPPANMLTLLDNLPMLQNKTQKVVLPLVYNALDSEHAVVQERALKMIPDLCDTIDYAELQGVLFPRLALVFTKTRVLTVKVATLVTFLAMVKTLDQSSLTQKMVPLLSKIRTKEPAMATLSVQEAMGSKVDREAVATLVLPQLWSMSMGPLLNVGQFQRFMEVIRKLADRVEKEHHQFLRDSQRLEDRSAIAVDGATVTQSFAGSMDFESLAGGKNGAVQTNATGGSLGSTAGKTSWDDDVWGSIFNDNVVRHAPPLSTTTSLVQSLSSSPKQHAPVQASRLGGSRPSLPSVNSFSPPNQHLGSMPSLTSNTVSPIMTPLHPFNTFSSPHKPVPPLSGGPQPQKPNYNITLPSVPPVLNPGIITSTAAMPAITPSVMNNSTMMSTLLTPSKPPQPSWNTSNKSTKDDWGDFDPLA